MKKILVIAAAALAFAACSKTEVLMPEAASIDFAPNALSTKALVLPNGNAGTTQNFPDDQTFNVFAFADFDGPNANTYVTNYKTPLMNDVTIGNQNGDWKAILAPGEDPYLWPATGTVDFYAYYPSSLTAVFDTLAAPKGIKLNDVVLGSSVGDQIDPLVASTLAQSAPNKPKVGIVFKHITSQIAVTAFDATKTKSLRGKIALEKVTFKNMQTSGNYTEGSTTGKGTWSSINTKADFTSFSGKEVLDTLESYLSADQFSSAINNSAAFVVIPEDILEVDNTNNTHQYIEVQYSVKSYTVNGLVYPAIPTQTINIPLFGKGVTGETLQNGKRYVFHLGLSLDKANNEIMFAPQVDGWDTEDINGITVDVVNNVLMNN